MKQYILGFATCALLCVFIWTFISIISSSFYVSPAKIDKYISGNYDKLESWIIKIERKEIGTRSATDGRYPLSDSFGNDDFHSISKADNMYIIPMANMPSDPCVLAVRSEGGIKAIQDIYHPKYHLVIYLIKGAWYHVEYE